MAQKALGHESAILRQRGGKAATSHLLFTSLGHHRPGVCSAGPRNGDGVWTSQHRCTLSSPTEIHDYTVPFSFVSFPSLSCPRPPDPACKYIFTITPRCTDL